MYVTPNTAANESWNPTSNTPTGSQRRSTTAAAEIQFRRARGRLSSSDAQKSTAITVARRIGGLGSATNA